MYFLRSLTPGIGIEKEELEHISQPFYRAENVSEISGHGIGLSLSEKIIQLHEGEMEIFSQYHQGTIVSITLPMSEYEINERY